MRIELICTGDELLCGDITDTNASWLATQLTEQGLKLSYKSTVADDLDELVDTFVTRSLKADFIIVNGGLGPTVDDLSAQAAAKALDEPVVMFDEWVKQMEQKFAAMDRKMLVSNLKQAQLPKSAEIIDNPIGTACGFNIVLNECTFVFTPGVPREFKPMVREQILPLLQVNQTSERSIKRYLCFGIGESALAQQINELDVPFGVEFGYRAAMPFVELKLFSHGAEVNKDELDDVITQLEAMISSYMVVKDGNSLSLLVHQLLVDKARQIEADENREFKFGTVESCTGGMVASQLVHYSGSSEYLNRSLVTYSNEAKQQLANVGSQTLAHHGAVSTQTAEQMAQGAVDKWGLDVAVSITGVAGPGGGSAEKPVGTVGFALATTTDCFSQLLYLPNRGRTAVRETAAAIALDMIRRYTLGIDIIGDYDSFKRDRG